MEHAPVLQIFGTTHVLFMAFLFVGGAAYISIALRCASDACRQRMGVLLGLAILAEEVLDRMHRVSHGARFVDMLPFHVCGLVILLTAAMLIFRERRLFAVCYYWGIGGAVPSMLTPDCQETFPDAYFLVYFVGHGLIVAGAMYATLVYRWRPTLKGIGVALLLLNLHAAFAGTVNYFAGSNFMYLCAKPGAASPMDWMHGWPWYILEMEPVALAVCLFLYAPFFFKDRFRDRPAEEREDSEPA